MKGAFIAFNRKLIKFSSLANDILQAGKSMPLYKKKALTEYVISETWQAWNTFTKDVIIKSVQGCRARDGLIISGRNSGCNDYWGICYEASCYAKNQRIKINGYSGFKHYHSHTWGDPIKIIDVISGFSPNNASRLFNGFGMLTYINDIQLIRNACAHKSREIILDLRSSLINRYNIRSVVHPSDYAWVLTLTGNDIAYFLWIREMKAAALYVTESA